MLVFVRFQGYSCGFQVHRGSLDALHAVSDNLTQRYVRLSAAVEQQGRVT